MGLFRQDKKPKTAAEYRQIAEEHAAKAKAMRHIFFKTGVFVISGLVAILAISAAWFVSNTGVRSTGAHIQANDVRTYYLATKASDRQGVYDDNTAENSALVQALKDFQRIAKEDLGEHADISFQDLPMFSVGTTKVTGSDNIEYIVGDADGISLMVNTTSNVKNVSAESHVGPGSKGELTFYLIPAVSGPNRANITVSLSAYRLTASEDSTDDRVTARAELIDGSDANDLLRNLLCGHMLLFRGKDANGDYINQLIPQQGSDGTIQFSIVEEGTWAENQPIPITLYWIWPHRFENLVYAGQGESVFQTSGTAQADFLSWINGHKEYIVNHAAPDSLGDADAGMSNSVLAQWSAGYNHGDQLIGDTVAYFVWTISTGK
ncbi:MAG: hypothetical protein ACI4FY_08635 [Acetatifactor sp.]